MITKRQIKRYMKLNVEDNLQEHSPWEVNCTALATDAAINGFDHPEWLDDETHEVWDAAVEVAEWYEKETPNA